MYLRYYYHYITNCYIIDCNNVGETDIKANSKVLRLYIL